MDPSRRASGSRVVAAAPAAHGFQGLGFTVCRAAAGTRSHPGFGVQGFRFFVCFVLYTVIGVQRRLRPRLCVLCCATVIGVAGSPLSARPSF